MTVNGTLTLPEGAKGNNPAVILMHNIFARGMLPGVAIDLNKQGFATFLVDSHLGRKIFDGAVPSEWKSDYYAYRIADAYAALDLLATHPRIDRNRIAIMGRSVGSAPALFTASEKIRRNLVRGKLQFAAHVGITVNCWYQMKTPAFTGAPILMLHGKEDTIYPVETCVTYAERIQLSGTKVRLVAYEKSYANFDQFNVMPSPINIPNYSKCQEYISLLQEDGSWFVSGLNKSFERTSFFSELNKGCKFGFSNEGGTPQAKEDYKKDFHAFLKETLEIQ